MKIIDGREIAKKIKLEIKKEVEKLTYPPTLGAISVGKNELSSVFLRQKEKACSEVGMRFLPCVLKQSSFKEISATINQLNQDEMVNGIFVQLPLPLKIPRQQELLDTIDLKKDVDCLTSVNFGKFVCGLPAFIPPTTQAVDEILKVEKVEVRGKNVVVVGSGRVGGLPVIVSLLQKNATVTICNEFSKKLGAYTKKAEILISAVGHPNLIKRAMVKNGAVVIDIGASESEEGLVGDVDSKGLKKIASKITPVPGGVGPLMVAFLLENVLKAVKLQKG